MPVPNIFGTATSAIPLSQLDTNFATPVTIGNTAVQLGNTVTSFGNVTLTNVTISSGNVIVTGANVSGTANVSTLVVTGNQTSLGNVAITGNISANIATFGAGSNTAPSITTVGDTNTGIFFPAADTIAFSEGGTEAMRIDSSGNVGVGATPSAWSSPVKAVQLPFGCAIATIGAGDVVATQNAYFDTPNFKYASTTGVGSSVYRQVDGTHRWSYAASGTAGNNITFTEAARIDTSGNLLVGKTSDTFSAVGGRISPTGVMTLTADSNELANFNRLTNDGTLLYFSQASTIEGSISVSGTTVSYNGGHLSRYAQTTTAKDDSLVKGTVLSNLDAMNVYTDAEGNPVDNEQLNKVKVSDVEGDSNVAGVFVNWTHDDAHDVDEINMAMTGDMIIRIAQGVTVARGDLLMSAGDGTAKPQGDDIVRSKTVAKVTSTHVTCTYADGSYCVPCVLMAC